MGRRTQRASQIQLSLRRGELICQSQDQGAKTVGHGELSGSGGFIATATGGFWRSTLRSFPIRQESYLFRIILILSSLRHFDVLLLPSKMMVTSLGIQQESLLPNPVLSFWRVSSTLACSGAK